MRQRTTGTLGRGSGQERDPRDHSLCALLIKSEGRPTGGLRELKRPNDFMSGSKGSARMESPVGVPAPRDDGTNPA